MRTGRRAAQRALFSLWCKHVSFDGFPSHGVPQVLAKTDGRAAAAVVSRFTVRMIVQQIAKTIEKPRNTVARVRPALESRPVIAGPEASPRYMDAKLATAKRPSTSSVATAPDMYANEKEC